MKPILRGTEKNIYFVIHKLYTIEISYNIIKKNKLFKKL